MPSAGEILSAMGQQQQGLWKEFCVVNKEREILAHAQRLLAAEDLESAEKCLSSNVLQFPESAALQFVLGTVYQRQTRYEDAVLCFENAGRISPAFSEKERCYNIGTCYFFLHNFGRAESSFREALRICPAMCAAEEKLAIVLYYQDRFEESIRLLEKILADSPEDYRAFYWLGLCWQRLGDHRRAIECLTSAVTHLDNHASAWAALALSHWIMNDDTNALSAVERALYFDLMDSDVLVDVSHVLADLGQLDRVLDLFKGYTEQHPEDSAAKAGYALFLAKGGAVENAMLVYREAVKGQPDSLNGAEDDLWRGLQELGEYQYALEVCQFLLGVQIRIEEHLPSKERLQSIVESLDQPEEALRIILASDETLLARQAIQSTRTSLEAMLAVSSPEDVNPEKSALSKSE